jgi:hypothetical protein
MKKSDLDETSGDQSENICVYTTSYYQFEIIQVLKTRRRSGSVTNYNQSGSGKTGSNGSGLENC